MEFKHPKYYKNLRKLYRSRNRDQAISEQDPTGSKERAPGTGLKLSDSTMVKQRASSSTSRDQKQQASSAKQQASSESKPEPSSGSQAASDKR